MTRPTVVYRRTGGHSPWVVLVNDVVFGYRRTRKEAHGLRYELEVLLARVLGEPPGSPAQT